MKYFPMKNESIHMSNSTEELLQKDNFTVVAAIAASIQS
jgi:oxaloacetate decarboxylase gamma subunit